MLTEVTPLILTFNEAPNIERTLSRLSWASRIVVVDSFSTDATAAICRRFPQVDFIQRTFESFADQCNFGLSLIRTEWALSLDADYVLGEGLAEELQAMKPDSAVVGYTAGFTYCVLGSPLRASLYPPRTVLYRKDRAKYHDEGHGHRVEVNGAVQRLRKRILHDDRKPLERWFGQQLKYAVNEAKFLSTAPRSVLKRSDRIRKLIFPAPVLVLFYTLFVKGLILDGWPGWYYAGQRVIAELLLSLRLMEARFKSQPPADG